MSFSASPKINNLKNIEKYYLEAVNGLNTNILNNQELWYNYVLNLPKHLQIIYTVYLFDSQIQNGGLHQYFFNSYGQFAFLTINNLGAIKAFERSEILVKAINKINEDKLDQDQFRSRIFNRKLPTINVINREIEKYLDDLDTECYNLENEDIETLIIDYLNSLNN